MFPVALDGEFDMNGVATKPAKIMPEESFRVEELYELQRRQGRLKPPAVSFEQRSSLKGKLARQEQGACSVVRGLIQTFTDFGSLLSFLICAPSSGVSDGFHWLKYALFGSSTVDNIRSGRSRLWRQRPTYCKNSRDLLQLNMLYDPHNRSYRRT